MSSSALSRCARAASRVLLGFTLVAVFGGASCWYKASDDDDHCDDDDTTIDDDDDYCRDDDDGGFDDDDDFFAPAAGGSGGLISAREVSDQLSVLQRPGLQLGASFPGSVVDSAPQIPELPLSAYRFDEFRLVAGDLPGLHPLRSIADISGLSLFDLWGPGDYGPSHLAQFADLVLAANRDLIGPEVGALHFDQVLFTSDVTAVRYVQTLDERDLPSRALPDAEVLVVFDMLGRLVQVENTTWVPHRSHAAR